MLLGGPVVARERKGCRWGGAEEGHVHDPLYAGVDGCVDKVRCCWTRSAVSAAETINTVRAPSPIGQRAHHHNRPLRPLSPVNEQTSRDVRHWIG